MPAKVALGLMLAAAVVLFLMAAFTPEAFGEVWDFMLDRVVGPGDYRPDNTY